MRAKLRLPLPIAPRHWHHHLDHPPPHISGKTVFRETGPWCQKGWGPLLYQNGREDSRGAEREAGPSARPGRERQPGVWALGRASGRDGVASV